VTTAELVMMMSCSPGVSTDDRVFWAGDRHVVVGPAVLAPRAIATWSE
jgi:hypothetical protein